MVKLTSTFSKLKSFNALVVGDFMLDKYTSGSVKRISPEAPVSVLEVACENYLPGGAGNVALNLVALGANVYTLGRVGKDTAGQILKEKLLQENINVENIFVQDAYTTPLKNRLLAEGQQLLRIDFETTEPIPSKYLNDVFSTLDPVLNKIDVIAISDYDKGFLTRGLLLKLIEEAKAKKIPIIVDPKGDDYSKYKGADIIKPNLKEAYHAVKSSSHVPLKEVASKLMKLTCTKHLLITLSKNGIALFDQRLKQKNFPVMAKEVKDVTGAGDTVLSILCAAVANGIDIDNSVQFANIAAGIAIEKLGCAKVSLPELAKRLLEQDMENKIFDASHLFALNKILDKLEFAILSVDNLTAITSDLFIAIRDLTKKHQKLIVYIDDNHPDDNVVNLLSSLHEVDYIILKTKTMKEDIKKIIKTKYHYNWSPIKRVLISSFSM